MAANTKALTPSARRVDAGNANDPSAPTHMTPAAHREAPTLPGMRGTTEASTTRRPSTPCTRSCVSTTDSAGEPPICRGVGSQAGRGYEDAAMAGRVLDTQAAQQLQRSGKSGSGVAGSLDGRGAERRACLLLFHTLHSSILPQKRLQTPMKYKAASPPCRCPQWRWRSGWSRGCTRRSPHRSPL